MDMTYENSRLLMMIQQLQNGDIMIRRVYGKFSANFSLIKNLCEKNAMMVIIKNFMGEITGASPKCVSKQFTWHFEGEGGSIGD